jgi:hypothetical protein
MRLVYIFAANLLLSVPCFAVAPGALGPYEQAQIQLEQRKLDQNQSFLEWTKALGGWLPVIAAVYAFVSLRKTLESQAMTKAIELALNAASPEETLNRASLISRLMGKSLPKDFEESLKQSTSSASTQRTAAPHILEARSNVIRMLAEFPMQREQILKDWIACFGPGDGWAIRVQKGVVPIPVNAGSTVSSEPSNEIDPGRTGAGSYDPHARSASNVGGWSG